MTNDSIVIVGASLAGAKAAEAARKTGYDGRIVLVGDEPHPPYERPPLSKDVLRGEKPTESAQVHPADFYESQRIELVTGQPVTKLDVGARSVTLADGTTLGFGSAVLATGTSPRKLAIPGAELSGVHVLRTVGDSVALGTAIRSAGRVAVIGAGWIGSEVAASARQLGADVVMIDPSPVPLFRVLGREMGDVFGRLHADHGVTLRLGTGVEELRGSGAVSEVVLSDGSVEAADLVVAGIGVTPNVSLATDAGLDVDNGVLVDEQLKTSAPGVYAAGDVANQFHPRYGRRIRVEHWANALNQGATAGRNAAGTNEVYDRWPYFYSDQYDLGMEYVGYGSADDTVVVRGSVEDRKFIAFWVRDDRVTAAMNVNVWDVVDDLKAILDNSQPADPARLADSGVPLADLA